jgi:hypothetical protein
MLHQQLNITVKLRDAADIRAHLGQALVQLGDNFFNIGEPRTKLPQVTREPL